MNPERDTHFLGFATLLIRDVGALRSTETETGEHYNVKDLQTLIAQRAYDLVVHTIYEYGGTPREFAVSAANETPDLTEWPE